MTSINKKQACIGSCILLIALCGSCNKENQSMQGHVLKQVQLEVPVYNSWSDVYDIIVTVESFDSLPLLIAYEQQAGRISIGRISNMFYDSINPGVFENEEDMISFIDQHQRLLDTFHLGNDEIVVLPKWNEVPLRYVANKDGLFAVGDTVVHLMKYGYVYTDIANFDELMDITDENIDNYDSTVFHSKSFWWNFPPSPNEDYHELCDYRRTIKTQSTNGKNRIVLKIWSFSIPVTTLPPQVYDPLAGTVTQDPPEPTGYNKFYTKVQILNLHNYFFNWWWKKTRETSCNGYVTVHKKGSNDVEWTTETVPINLNNKKFKEKNIAIYISTEEPEFENIDNHLHLFNYNVSAWATSTGTAQLSWVQ